MYSTFPIGNALRRKDCFFKKQKRRRERKKRNESAFMCHKNFYSQFH